MGNENFDGFCQNLLQTKIVLIALLNLSIFSWSLSKIRHRDKSACSEYNPVQSRRSKLMTCLRFQEKGLCSDSNWSAQQFQMVMCQSLETISGMILNQLQPNFWVPNSLKWKAMFEIHVETCIDWTSFNFWVKDFLSNLLRPLKMIITYSGCVTDQSSMTRSWRSVLNFKFSVQSLTFLRFKSMTCSMSINLLNATNVLMKFGTVFLSTWVPDSQGLSFDSQVDILIQITAIIINLK